jgi:hypothetical protein
VNETETPFAMGTDYDSPLPGEQFKSVHEFSPWAPPRWKRLDYERCDATEDERDCPREDEVTK